MTIPSQVLSILLPLVQRFEGLRLTAYQDGAGVWTIGFGHTGPEVHEGLTWALQQAQAALEQDLTSHYSQLLGVSPSLSQASAGTQAALTDWVYNLGIGNYMHSSLRNVVDAGSWIAVKVQMARWDHVAGRVSQDLDERRTAEIALIDM